MGEHAQPVARRRLALLREPTVPLLLLATAVMVSMGYAADILLCVGTLALVVREGSRWRGRTGDATPEPLGSAARVAGCVAAALLGTPPPGRCITASQRVR